MASLYKDLVRMGIPTDHHESDLYVLDTPKARETIKKYGYKFTTFTSSIDHKRWIDVPFAYVPFWERATGRGSHAKKIVGFEFLIKDDGQSYWTRLQGSGGQLGVGSLHAVHNLGPKTPGVQSAVFEASEPRAGRVATRRHYSQLPGH